MGISDYFNRLRKSITGTDNPPENREQKREHNWGLSATSPFQIYKSELKEKFKGSFSWLYTHNDRGIRWDFDPILLRSLTQDNTWTGMLIEAIASEVAKTPWNIVEDDSFAETQKRIRTNPFERKAQKQADGDRVDQLRNLFKRPNNDLDFESMIHETMADPLEIGSTTIIKDYPEEAYRMAENPAGKRQLEIATEEYLPSRLRPAPPEVFTKEFKDQTITTGYWMYDRIKTTGKKSTGWQTRTPLHFDKNELIWKDINPRTNRVYGLPPALLVQDVLELLELTVTQEKNIFSRGLISPGAIVFEDLDRSQIDSFKTDLQEDIKGNPDKVPLLGGGSGGEGDVHFEDFSQNFRELQYIEREQWMARIISSAFQVPTAVVGLDPESVSYKNFQGERAHFEANTLGSYLRFLEKMWNLQLVWSDFFPDRRYRFEFQPGLSEAQRSKITDTATRQWESGGITRNEYRQQIGQDPIEGEKGEEFNESGGSPMEQIASNVEEKVSDIVEEKIQKNDGGLRSENWQMFDFQQSDVDELKEEISEEVKVLWQEVLSDEDIEKFIEMRANKEEKSIGSISSKLKSLLEVSNMVDKIKEIVRDHTTEKVQENMEERVSETDLETDQDPVVDRIKNRDMQFADDYAKQMENDIRDTIQEGWTEGKATNEIINDLRSEADKFTDSHAELIARDQMQKANGEARNEFAKQHADKFGEVWLSVGVPPGKIVSESQAKNKTVGDGRNRSTHLFMNGKWKRPNEKFFVPYKKFDEGKNTDEQFPGSSKFGIQCRCDTQLKSLEELDDENHVGV